MNTGGGHRQRWFVVALTAVVALGAILRTLFLGSSVVLGDEIHVLTSVHLPLGEILAHFQRPDNCIPITAFSRIALLTVGLDEWGLRILSVVPGVLLVWLLPRMARHWLPAPEQLLLALVLATSPLLVFWSRIARPYSASALLSVLAVAGAARFLRERKLRWLLAAASCQVGLFYFSPTAGPALAALALSCAIWGGSSASPGRRIRQALTAMLPAVLAAGILLVSVAPWSLLEILPTAHDPGRLFSVKTLIESAMQLFGFVRSDLPWLRALALVPVLFTGYGLFLWCCRNKRLAVPTLVFLFLPSVLYASAQFDQIGVSEVFLRYQASALPFLLAFLVYGFAGLRGALERSSPGQFTPVLVAGFAAVVALVALGPLKSGAPPQYPFGLKTSRMRLTPQQMPGFRVERDRLSAFYGQVAGEKGAVLVECTSTLPAVIRFIGLQQHHGARVVRAHFGGPAAFRTALLDPAFRGGLQLRTILLGFDALREKVPPGGYVVLHKQPAAEWRYVTRGGQGRRSKPDPDLRLFEEAAPFFRGFFGAPVFEDEWLEVYRREAAVVGDQRPARR